MGYGVGPYGYGLPVPEDPPLEARLGQSRRIGTGPETRGQYVLADDANPEFGTDVQQMVVLALTTARGSAAVVDLGRAREPADFGVGFTEAKRAQVRDALAHLVASRMVTIDSVDVVEAYGGRSYTRVLLTDLTRKQQIKVEL